MLRAELMWMLKSTARSQLRTAALAALGSARATNSAETANRHRIWDHSNRRGRVALAAAAAPLGARRQGLAAALAVLGRHLAVALLLLRREAFPPPPPAEGDRPAPPRGALGAHHPRLPRCRHQVAPAGSGSRSSSVSSHSTNSRIRRESHTTSSPCTSIGTQRWSVSSSTSSRSP